MISGRVDQAMKTVGYIPQKEKREPQFDKRMYGALLRHMRMEAGYRKGEDFIADLSELGLSIPVATLYRYERGEQEPTFEFISAVNLLLFGNAHSDEITGSCISEDWTQPSSSDTVMRVLKRSGALNRLPNKSGIAAADRAAHYDKIMSSTNSYDFKIFPNLNCTDDELHMTVRYGAFNEELPEMSEMESYQIECSEDVERAIINFLKSHDFDISGEEIDKLVQYGNRRMQPQLEAYGLI